MQVMNWMKAVVIALGVAGGFAGGWLTASPAKCVFCPTYPCFGSCGGRCVCMRNDSRPGQCVSFDRVEQYKTHGYAAVNSK